jgi:hypothetical protein
MHWRFARGGMATEPEIHRVRNDSDEARKLSKFLLDAYLPVLTDWEADFLEDMKSKKFADGLSYRQAEKLFQIRDDCHSVTHHRGLSLKVILQRCWEGRRDLSEGNEEFVGKLYSRNSDSVRSRDLPRLLVCAHQLGWIEPYMLIKVPEIDYAERAEHTASLSPASPPTKRDWHRAGSTAGPTR